LSPFFFSSRRRHTRFSRDWSSDVCSSDLHINTQNAYQSLSPRFPDTQVQDILRLAPEQWPEKLKNDFETPIFKTEPGLQEIKARSEERRVGKECKKRKEEKEYTKKTQKTE